MFAWISENIVTVIAITVIVLVCALAVWSLLRDKKKGKSCTGNCATCGMNCSSNHK